MTRPTWTLSSRGRRYRVRYNPELLQEGNVAVVTYNHRDGLRDLTYEIMEPYVPGFGYVVVCSLQSGVRRTVHPAQIANVRTP